MKTKIKDVSPCRVKFTVEATAEEIAPIYKSIRAAYAKNANIPGFRKGKVPAAKIEALFGSEMATRANERIQELCIQEAIKEKGADSMRLVEVTAFKASATEGATMEAIGDLPPTVVLPDVAKWQVKKAAPVVTDEAIEEQIAQLRQSSASFKEGVEGDTAGEQDLASISFTSDLDKDALSDAAKHYAEDKEYWVQLREDAFLPGLRDALLGKALNASFDLVSTYPADYRIEDLAGKTVNYKVTLTELRKMTPADDEAVVARMGLGSMEELRKAITEFLTSMEERKEEARVAKDLTAAIDATLTFDLPESEVERHALGAVVHAHPEVEKEFAGNLEGLKKDKRYTEAVENVTKDIRRLYAFEALAKQREVRLTGEEFEAALKRLGAKDKLSAKTVMERLQANGSTNEFIKHELAEKMFGILLKECATL